MYHITQLLYTVFVVLLVTVHPHNAIDTSTWFRKHLLPCSYKPDALTHLHTSLTTNVIGQPAAVSEIIALITQHLSNVQRAHQNRDNINVQLNKPLVLSLHGLTGTGKSLSAALIVDALYGNNAIELGHVYKFHGKRYDTPNINRHIYDITTHLATTITHCASPIYVFEEVHYMSTGVLDGLLPYMDYRAVVDGQNYNNAIFILTSNFGGQALQKLVYDAEAAGLNRGDIPYERVKQTVHMALSQPYAVQNGTANNNNTGSNTVMQRNKLQLLVDHSVVNRFVPFYPLFKPHVKQCAAIQLDQIGAQMVADKQIGKLSYDASVLSAIANKQQYRGSISVYGCKNINDVITVNVLPLIHRDLYKIEPEGFNKYDPLAEAAGWVYTRVKSAVHGPTWSLADKELRLHVTQVALGGGVVEEHIDVETKDIYKPQPVPLDVYGIPLQRQEL